MATDPTIPELPFVDSVLEAAKADLDTARSFQQRLLATQDTLLATALTVSGLFAGLAFSNHSRALAAAAALIVLALAWLDARNWVHFRRVSLRIRSLERLFDAHIKALRELKTARPQAVKELRKEVDRYQFGTERTIDAVTVSALLQSGVKRLRWWLYVAIALVMALSGLFWIQSTASPSVCIRTEGGGIAKISGVPTPARDPVTVVACPK